MKKFITIILILLSSSLVTGQDRDIKLGPAAEASSQKPEMVIQNGHHRHVSSVSFSPDEKILASGSWDNTIKLWDFATGKLIRTLEGHYLIWQVCFSPDGKILASGSDGYTIKLWDTSTGNLIRILKGHKAPVMSVCFGPDGKTLASGSRDNTIKIWDPYTGNLILTMEGHISDVTSVFFSHDGKTLASGSGDETIKLWEVSTGKLIRSLEGHSDWVWSVSFSPDGKTLASGSWDKTIKLWEASTGKFLLSLDGHSDEVTSVSFSPDGKTLASGSDDKTIKLWDTRSWRLIRTIEGPEVDTLAFSRDGKTLASNDGSMINLWDIQTGKQLLVLKGHAFAINSVIFSPDGKTLASSMGKNVYIWDTRSNKTLFFHGQHDEEVKSVSFSPNGKILASSDFHGIIKLWDTESGNLIRTLDGQCTGFSVSFSPNGKILASGNERKNIDLFDTSTGNLIKTLAGHSSFVMSVSFSPDGNTLASGGDTTIKIWEVGSGQLIRTINESNSVYAISFSNVGKILASGSYRSIKLWEPETGNLIKKLEGHSDSVRSVSFSPDGKTLASGSEDHTIRLWETETGKPIRTLIGAFGSVNSVSFSADGKTLASGSDDTTIRFWNLFDGRLLCTILPLDKDDWVAYTAEGYFDTSENGKNFIGWTVGMKNYGFEQFWDGYYRPGLFSRVISGEKIEGGKDLRQGFAPPPEVVILSPKAGETITGEVAQVKVQVTDTGGGIQFIRLYHQGKLSGFTEILSGSKPIETITYPVTLVEGENILRATAYSRDNIEAVPFEVKIRSAVAAKKPNLFILAVGINKYKYPGIDLSYSRADAEGILEFYRKQEGRIFERVYATALFDEEATRSKILDALKQPARPEDVAIIYLAGHGEAFSGKYYFLPYDLSDLTDEAIMKSGVSQEEIISGVRACQATKVLLILDSCKSGTLAVTMRGLEEKRAVMLLSKTAGVHVLAATAEQQGAAELSQFGHGLFTYEILDGLSGKADADRDRIVKVWELLDFVSREVERESEAHNRRQSPTVMMQGGNFPVAVY